MKIQTTFIPSNIFGQLPFSDARKNEEEDNPNNLLNITDNNAEYHQYMWTSHDNLSIIQYMQMYVQITRLNCAKLNLSYSVYFWHSKQLLINRVFDPSPPSMKKRSQGRKTGKNPGGKLIMIIVATTSLPAVNRPNADC